MLTLFCWIVYGQWPHQALTPETLAWAFPLAFILDLVWMAFFVWAEKRRKADDVT